MEKNKFRTRKVNIIFTNEEKLDDCIKFMTDVINKYPGLSYSLCQFIGKNITEIEDIIFSEGVCLPNFLVALNTNKSQKKYFNTHWFYDTINFEVDNLIDYLQTKIIED